jgi:hypothetical protein
LLSDKKEFTMTENDKLQMFEDQAIRTAWDEEAEEWYFSIVDVVKALTEQATVRGASNYWAKLKERLKAEGASELLTNCQQLKMKATDGKRHRCCQHRTTFAYHPVYSVQKSRTVQDVAGYGRARAH